MAEAEIGMVATGMAATGMVAVEVAFLSAALAFRFGAGDTLLGILMGTDITPTAPTLTDTATVVDTTAAAIMVEVIRMPATPTIATIPGTAISREWCAYSSNSPEPVIITERSMELWDPAPAMPCVPTSTIMVRAPTEWQISSRDSKW